MRLALPIVWSDRHRRHDPRGEVRIGVRTPATEVPLRAEAIRSALERLGATLGGELEAPPAVTPAGFRAAGGALGVPPVLLHDGGYDLTTIGALVCETLAGVQEGPARA